MDDTLLSAARNQEAVKRWCLHACLFLTISPKSFLRFEKPKNKDSYCRSEYYLGITVYDGDGSKHIRRIWQPYNCSLLRRRNFTIHLGSWFTSKCFECGANYLRLCVLEQPALSFTFLQAGAAFNTQNNTFACWCKQLTESKKSANIGNIDNI